MRRVSTHYFRCILLSKSLAFVLVAGALVYGQSLGDVARESREKKAASASTPAKVITNADLAKDDEESLDEPQAVPAETAASSRKAVAQRAAEQRAAEHWRQKILAQKNTIAEMQARVDALRASIQFVDPNAYSNGYVYNRYQARQIERLKVMEAQLAGQKQKLEDMQETARHAGMHTPVYDP
jgi:hypothetical protein